jgi:hypothetical protein
MNGELHNLDWVSKRASCSIEKAFEELKGQVQTDVETRNSLRPQAAHYGFAFKSAGNSFSVSTESNAPSKSIVFVLSKHSISVKDGDGNLILESTVTLNDEGECKPKINGQEREYWQLRRMALEKLFYETF